jgi:hypothetical protein
MAVLFAFSLQHEVEKYGAYVGLAAFLGLAVLTVLYFAQARELKRLRDWAGRAPERAQEIEAQAVANADELRRVPAPAVAASGNVGPAQPVAKPAAAPAPSGNGRGAGTPAPIPIGPRPAVAVAAAAARAAEAGPVTTEEAPEPIEDEAPDADATQLHPAPTETDGDSAPQEVDGAPPETGDEAAASEAAEEPAEADDESPETGEEEVEEAAAPSGNGTGSHPPVIPRATPRPQPRPEPAAPLRASTPSRAVPQRRPAPQPPRSSDDGSSRAARFTLITVGGIVAVALLAFGATKLFGGGGEEPKAAPNVAQSPTGSTGSGSNSGGGGNADVSAKRPGTVVTVLNGTPTDGLAGTTRDKLVKAGYSDEVGLVRTGNNTDQQRQDSVVFYASGQRAMARDVAKVLGITTRPEAIDADTQALADNTGEGAAGHATDVVVIVGSDQSP